MINLRALSVLSVREGFFLAFVVVLAVSSFMSLYSAYNFLPATALFEAAFAALALSCLHRFRSNPFFISSLILCVGYILLSMVVFVGWGEHGGFRDFFVIYKVFYYLVLLTVMLGSRAFGRISVDLMLKFLIFVFLLKYGLVHILNIEYVAGSIRPGVFHENNFELMFLLLTLVVRNEAFGFVNYKLVGLVFVVFLLSGSRSGALMFVVYAIFMPVPARYFYAKWLFVLISFVGGAILFYSRLKGAELDTIDRVVFMMFFLEETQTFGLKEWLFGQEIITPVSNYVANALSFYEELFSSAYDGLAFSVVFHSFILRTVFDHGFLGLFVVLVVVFKLIRSSGFSTKISVCVVLMLIANGLSVSSLNSVFCAVGLMLFVSFDWGRNSVRSDCCEAL